MKSYGTPPAVRLAAALLVIVFSFYSTTGPNSQASFVAETAISMVSHSTGSHDPPQDTPTDPTGETSTLLVGTYTGGKSQGVYGLELNEQTGQLKQTGLVAELQQPSFVAPIPGWPAYFLAVQESDHVNSVAGGGVSLLERKAAAGAAASPSASVVAQRSSFGGAPCHVITNAAGNLAVLANYSGGSYAIYRLDTQQAGKAIGLSPGSVFQNQGSGQNAERQESPHGHCVRFLPGCDDRLVAADLGTNELLLFQVVDRAGEATLEKIFSLPMPEGAGPRQIDFHPNGKYLYVINELNSTVSQVAMKSGVGDSTKCDELELLQTLSTLPNDFSGDNSTAHIQVHPGGKFLYGSNRGHDSIAMFAIDPETGHLQAMGHQASGGQTPRHFVIMPSGKFLLAANQNSDNVVVFPIDAETGQLGKSVFQAAVFSPVCVMPMARQQ